MQRVYVCLISDDKCLYKSCTALLLELEDLFRVDLAANDRPHLCLVQNKFDLVKRHGVEESNSRDAVVHASEFGHCPLPSVLEPNTEESPIIALSLNLFAQVQGHQSLGKGPCKAVSITPRLPLVVTKHWLSICSLRFQLTSRAHERVIGSLCHVFLEVLVECGALILQYRKTLYVVIVLRIDTRIDQLSREAGLCGQIFSPTSVVVIPDDTIAHYVCFNHSSKLFSSCSFKDFILIIWRALIFVSYLTQL